MGEEQRMILDMLAQGKISVIEAERLLDALREPGGAPGRTRGASTDQPTFVDRINKVAVEMGEAGQELPQRLSGLIDSLVGLASRFGYSAEQVFEGITSSVEEISKVDLSTTNGSVRLRGWDGTGYRVIARAQVKGVADRERAQAAMAEGLRVSVKDGTLGIDCIDKALLSSLSVDAAVPSRGKYDVLVNSRNGSVTVDGVEARTVEARSMNGRITLERLQAEAVDASTKNGSIYASGELGNATIETANGSISASLNYEHDGSLKMSTGNGSIKVEIPKSPAVQYTVNAGAVNGAVKVDIDDAGTVKSESPHTGARRQASVTVPGPEGSDKSVDVEARAVNGSITVVTA